MWCTVCSTPMRTLQYKIHQYAIYTVVIRHYTVVPYYTDYMVIVLW